MVVAVAKPLVDIPPCFGSEGRPPEDLYISRLASNIPFHRAVGAKWLKRNGDAMTASKLESMILEGKVPAEALKDVGNVLKTLSWDHREFGNSIQGRISRFSAIMIAAHPRKSVAARVRV
jgi:hypothetical protein